jgi:hypothetical protein
LRTFKTIAIQCFFLPIQKLLIALGVTASKLAFDQFVVKWVCVIYAENVLSLFYEDLDPN